MKLLDKQMWYKVQGTRYKVQGTRYKVQGTINTHHSFGAFGLSAFC
jgi:hypothetical protein